MRRLLLSGIAALTLLLIHPTHSDAVIVECANCSSWVEQLISDAKQAAQYATQLQQRATQLQQYANQVQNTIALPTSVFSQVMNDINQVRGIANAASLLTGNSGSILSRLQNAQGVYNSASYLPENIGQQFQMWQQTFGNASNSLGRVLGVQQGQMTNYASMQQAINLHGQTATGQMQAIQAGVEMSSLMSTQLNQVQTTLLAQAQQQATRDMVAADRTAAEDAAMQRFLIRTPVSLAGGRGYP